MENASGKKIFEVLRSIGLSRNEVVIFLDLARRGSSSALEISKRTKVYRSNVYDSLSVLVQKGFVGEVVEGKRRVFRLLDLSSLKEYVLQRERDVDSILPELSKIALDEDLDSSIFVSRGISAVRLAMNNLLNEGEEIKVYGIPFGFRDKLGGGFLKNFHERRVLKKIPIRIIYSKDAFDEGVVSLGRMSFTEVRYDRRSDVFRVVTFVCGKKLLIVVLGSQVTVMEISALEVARAYGDYFEILWNFAKSKI